jgi:hypothetical protein
MKIFALDKSRNDAPSTVGIAILIIFFAAFCESAVLLCVGTAIFVIALLQMLFRPSYLYSDSDLIMAWLGLIATGSFSVLAISSCLYGDAYARSIGSYIMACVVVVASIISIIARTEIKKLFDEERRGRRC